MDKFVVRRSTSPDAPQPLLRRTPWKRSVVELIGRLPSKYRHEISALLLESYSEIGAFPHLYHIGQSSCLTHTNRMINSSDADLPRRREGISGLDFDTKGIYVASVTKSGCLTVHEFETLFCLSNGTSSCLKEDEGKHLLHLSTHQQLDVVRWNLANQDEVACTSRQSNEVPIYDIGYVSAEPVEVLRKKPTVTVHGCEVPRGLSDIAFTSSDKSRLLASDMYGVISMWDRRMSNLPCLQLATNSHNTLNSIQMNVENQIVFGAGKHGIIYAWDLRGGRSSYAFQNHKEVYHPPLTSVKLAPIFEGIGSLKAQSDIFSREIHSIDLDPSCPYQLAFHLDDEVYMVVLLLPVFVSVTPRVQFRILAILGSLSRLVEEEKNCSVLDITSFEACDTSICMSGVLDTNSSQVTHIHCPPPAWLNGPDMSNNCLYLRKPTWLPTSSIYAVGSSSDNGIHLLDFYPGPNSACHVDPNEDIQNTAEEKNENPRNRFIPLSERVSVCAAHPLNGTIIAGTKQSSLLVVSQRHQSYRSEDSNTSNEKDS